MKDKILALTEDTVLTLGYVLVETKLNPSKSGMALKAVIHKKGGNVSMDDCARLSNVLLRRLEVEIPDFSEKYSLVVESPGADRKLPTIREVGIFQDREMLFTLKDPVKFGRKDNAVQGWVDEISGNRLKISSDGAVLDLEWDDIAGVRLYFNIKNYL